MVRSLIFLTIILSWLPRLPGAMPDGRDQPPDAVVHAVLFFSPACGHCHYVIEEVLPPLFEEYGDRLQMIGIDASTPSGQVLFQAALRRFNMDQGGVPFLVIGDVYLVGSIDIPEKFPGLIEGHLKRGGVDWPAIPGLAEALAAATGEPTAAAPDSPVETAAPAAPVEANPTAEPTQPAAPVEPGSVAETAVVPAFSSPTDVPGGLILGSGSAGGRLTGGYSDAGIREKLMRDPAGNLLAVVVLIGMIASLVIAAPLRGRMKSAGFSMTKIQRLVPAVCLVGIVVAGYLAYIETTQTKAICGPIGDCNTVQQSEYARLFGVLPIGVLGLVGYVLILLAWLAARRAVGECARRASAALLIMTTGGLLFSIYLTFLEPFVISATCAWCLASSVMMTALFWLSLLPGGAAISRTSKPEAASSPSA